MASRLGGSGYVARLGGRTHIDKTKFPALSAQQPPTQGHDRDMGTTPNTAAIYVRRSAFDADNEEADAFSRSIARCLVPGVTREELPDHFSS